MPSSDVLDFVMKKCNGIKGLVDKGLESVPQQCIQEPKQRLDHIVLQESEESESIPTIDVSKWDVNVAKSLQEAASKWGFFQIINHGIPHEVLEELKEAAHRFFELPAEEKKKYYKEKPGPCESVLMYWHTLGDRKVLEWRDSIMHGCNPGDDTNLWPPQTREQVLEFKKRVIPLAKKLLEMLLKGLNVNEIDESLEPALMGNMNININYYPPCPDPSLTVGCGRHCDVSCITVLLQDDTGGLYVRGTRENNWIHVTPVKGALAVNIGDSLQIMSNDRYKSVEHCVAVHPSKARISVPLFVNPRLDAVIGPFPQLLQQTGEKPVYKQLLFSDYWDNFFSKRPLGKSTLDFARI